MVRDTYWDIMKGLGIIAIVIGHTGSPLVPYVYMYHLLLFFFISGYLYNDKHSLNPADLIGKRVKSLYLPFIQYNLIILAFHNIFLDLHIYNREQLGGLPPTSYFGVEHFISYANNILLFNGADQMGGATWFMIALFSLIVVFSVIRYISLKMGKYHMISTLIIIAGLTVFGFWRMEENLYLGLNMDVVLIVLPFFLIGFLFSHYKKNIPLHWLPAIACVCILYVAYSKFQYSHLDIRKITYPIVFIFTSFVGIYLNLYIGKLIMKVKKLEGLIAFIGQYSLAIMALHFLAFKVVSLIYIWSNNLPISDLAKFPVIDVKWLWPFYVIVGVGLPIIFIRGLRYFASGIVGLIKSKPKNLQF